MDIVLFGKNIVRQYAHHIMKIDRGTLISRGGRPRGYALRSIDTARIAEELAPVGTTVTPANLRKLLSKNGALCEGFIFEDASGEAVGTVWVMYRGGDDLEYRIRNTEAYIFDVFVREDRRGRGIAGEMLCSLMERLHEKGIDSACLAVSVTNDSAIRAYVKAGFETICDKRFARVLKVNIPYHIL